jgi:hypothetical protein
MGVMIGSPFQESRMPKKQLPMVKMNESAEGENNVKSPRGPSCDPLDQNNVFTLGGESQSHLADFATP